MAKLTSLNFKLAISSKIQQIGTQQNVRSGSRFPTSTRDVPGIAPTCSMTRFATDIDCITWPPTRSLLRSEATGKWHKECRCPAIRGGRVGALAGFREADNRVENSDERCCG